jgi:uncharacterized protein (DUF4415 family)
LPSQSAMDACGRSAYGQRKPGSFDVMATARRKAPRHTQDDEPVDDEDNPEWTDDDFKRARPASELPKEVLAAFPKMRGRPPKAPEERKVAISIRLHPRVLAHYKAAGRGWQTHMEQILIEAAMKEERRRRASSVTARRGKARKFRRARGD